MITLNGFRITPTIFPDKTSQVWKIPEETLHQPFFYIEWEFESESEIMHVAQIVDLVRAFGSEIILDMRYLPYARQDKAVSNETTFALRTFCNLINSLCLDQVRCFDPHSKVADQWLRNFLPTYPFEKIKTIAGLVEADMIFYPDHGAMTKYSKEVGLSFISGDKKRDPSSGQITGYRLDGLPQSHRILIVDDICDGGATFVLAAQALKEHGAREIHLYVSHGLFSKGTQILRDAGIQRIFTKEGEVK